MLHNITRIFREIPNYTTSYSIIRMHKVYLKAEMVTKSSVVAGYLKVGG